MPTPTFDGTMYDEALDCDRLKTQLHYVLWALRSLGVWSTVQEVREFIGAHHRQWFPEASISAQIRNLRKEQHGSHRVDSRYRVGSRIAEYRLVGHPSTVMGE